MSSLYVEVLSALGDLYIKEGYVTDADEPDKWWIAGTYDRGTVTVNPIPHVVDTLIHEVLHHIRPQWSERTVRAQTTKLLRAISHEEAQEIYRQYLARKF